MIVEYNNYKFQVMFFHKNKECKCEIWVMSNLPTNELEYLHQNSKVRSCVSKKHPDTISKLLLAKTSAKCAESDNYIYAYGRALSLKRALRVLIDNSSFDTTSVEYYEKDPIPFKFDNEAFKKFMHELKVQCPHGVEAAEKLQHTKGYNLNEEWMSQNIRTTPFNQGTVDMPLSLVFCKHYFTQFLAKTH